MNDLEVMIKHIYARVVSIQKDIEALAEIVKTHEQILEQIHSLLLDNPSYHYDEDDVVNI